MFIIDMLIMIQSDSMKLCSYLKQFNFLYIDEMGQGITSNINKSPI